LRKIPVLRLNFTRHSAREILRSKGYKLQSHMSIFMCELTAIYLALSWIQDFKPLNTAIFVDSLSALQAIRGSKQLYNKFLLRLYVFVIESKHYIIFRRNFCRVCIIKANDIKVWLSYKTCSCSSYGGSPISTCKLASEADFIEPVHISRDWNWTKT
jgi:ribonuclease HI